MDVLEKTKKILTFDKNIAEEDIGLPPFLVTKICDSSPEIVFMLMYRLFIRKDEGYLTMEIRKKILGIFTLFSWFGKGVKLKNHEALIRNISKAMKTFDAESFWSHITVGHARRLHHEQDVLFPILSKKIESKIRDIINGNESNITYGAFDKIKDGNIEFYRKAFFERSLVIYAQRKYFDKVFPSLEMELDDTNVPFDWDHISPQNLIRRNGAYQSVKDWYSSNGNFRALSYSENRSKSDAHPSDSLKNETAMSDFFCNYKNWSKHNFDREHIKNTENQKMIFRLIMERNRDIYMEWFSKLGIGELLKEDDNSYVLSSLWNMLDQETWTYNRKEALFFLKMGDNNTEIYFEFDEDLGVLEKGAAQVGIFMKNKSSLADVTLDPSKIIKTDAGDGYVVKKDTTLEGKEDSHFLYMIQEFVDHLACFDKGFGDGVYKLLRKNLLIEYRDRVRCGECEEDKTA